MSEIDDLAERAFQAAEKTTKKHHRDVGLILIVVEPGKPGGAVISNIEQSSYLVQGMIDAANQIAEREPTRQI